MANLGRLIERLMSREAVRIAAWRLTGRRIDRDQWQCSAEVSAYEAVANMSWDTLQQQYPQYWRRLDLAVRRARGRVLEIGAGSGNMTKWLARSPDVSAVVAVEPFPRALDQLRELALPGVEPRQGSAESLLLLPGEQFDTVLVCELIEHLYPDEEQAMLRSLAGHLAAGAGYVVSTPVGWMNDPFHVRGFSPARLRRHLQQQYGPVTAMDASAGYSQVAWGLFGNQQAG